MTFDGKGFGAEIVEVVKGYMAKELGPISTRLDDIERRIATLPAPVDFSQDLASIKAAFDAIVIPEVPELPSLPDIPSLVAKEVEKAVAALPAPKDGEPGRDGLDVKNMFRAEGGHLIAVMSDGTTRDLGVFVGKDGEPGEDGKDGFSLEDFDATLMDDGRTVLLSFAQGERSFKVELGFPVMVYRGVYREGAYSAGDTVTWGGSLWHCDGDTDEKPGEGSRFWTLCAKRGRDGKDFAPTEPKAVQPVRVGVPARS